MKRPPTIPHPLKSLPARTACRPGRRSCRPPPPLRHKRYERGHAPPIERRILPDALADTHFAARRAVSALAVCRAPRLGLCRASRRASCSGAPEMLRLRFVPSSARLVSGRFSSGRFSAEAPSRRGRFLPPRALVVRTPRRRSETGLLTGLAPRACGRAREPPPPPPAPPSEKRARSRALASRDAGFTPRAGRLGGLLDGARAPGSSKSTPAASPRLAPSCVLEHLGGGPPQTSALLQVPELEGAEGDPDQSGSPAGRGPPARA